MSSLLTHDLLYYCTAVAAIIATAQPGADASVIPITAIEAFQQGDSAVGGDGAYDRVTDGSGMTMAEPDDPSTWLADNAWEADWQGQNTNFEDQTANWVVLDLGSAQATLDTMYLWNVNEGNHAARGVMNFEVFSATAPTVTPPVTGEINQNYDFTSGQWTALGSGFLTQGTGNIGLTPDAFDISEGAGARYIGIRFDSAHANDLDRVGLSEVAFSDVADANAATLGEPGTPVDPPEPPDPPAVFIPITNVFAFHQGDSLDADGSTLRVFDASINTTPDPDDPETWTHSNAWQDDWQGFEAPGVTPNGTWAVLDLGEAVNNIQTLLLWNVNEGSHSARGMNEFKLHTATAPTLPPPAASGNRTPYDFASGGWTVFGDTRTLGEASELTAEPLTASYDLTGIAPTRYLGIEILSNHGASDRVGFAHAVVLKGTGPGQRFEIIDIDISEVESDRITITWRSRPGQLYGLAYSHDLGSWIELSDGELGQADAATTSYTEIQPGDGDTPAISSRPRRYYQVFEIPPD